jgi:phosphoribosylformylglycinamidine synthase subunit PurS
VIFRVEVFVTLKPTVNDPAGLTIRGGLHALGFGSVADVRSGKYLVLTLDEDDEETARARVEEMSRQLLANEVIEDFRIELQQESPSPLAGEALDHESPSLLAGAGPSAHASGA